MIGSNPLELPCIGADIDEQVLTTVRYMVGARRDADDPRASPAVCILALSIGHCQGHHQTPVPYSVSRRQSCPSGTGPTRHKAGSGL